jgi:hypothetical protein
MKKAKQSSGRVGWAYRITFYNPSTGPGVGESVIGSQDFTPPPGIEMQVGEEVIASFPQHPTIRGKIVRRTFDIANQRLEIRADRIQQ